jgi:CheY-like chemotaxis protein
VEDSQEDFEAIQRFVHRYPIPIPLRRCVTGDQALDFLYRNGRYADPDQAPRPGLIVLDLNLPGIDGREVLRQIKQDENLNQIPVAVFTTSNNPRDIEVCYQYGVDYYIVKPIDFAQLKQDMQRLIDYWLAVTTPPDALPDPSEDQA